MNAQTLNLPSQPHAPLSVWQWWGRAMVVPYLLIFVIFVLYPVGYGLWLARHPQSYVDLMNDPIFFRSAANTFVFLVVAINIKMAVALGLSDFFVNTRWWVKWVAAIFILPWAVPSIPTILSGLVNLVGCIVLVGPLGITGINIAMVISMFVYTGAGYFFGNHYYPIKFNFIRNFISLGILGVWQVAIYLVDKNYTEKLIMNGLLKTALAILFIGSLYVFNKDFRSKATNTIRGMYRKYVLKNSLAEAA